MLQGGPFFQSAASPLWIPIGRRRRSPSAFAPPVEDPTAAPPVEVPTFAPIVEDLASALPVEDYSYASGRELEDEEDYTNSVSSGAVF